MNPLSMRKSKIEQRGSSLLEALIALTIFSMGILGTMGLQAKIIGLSMDASYRTDATFLANQIIGQIWVDPVVNSIIPNTAYECNPCDVGSANTNIQDWVKQTHGTMGVLPPYGDYATCPSSITVGPNPKGLMTIVTVTIKWKLPSDNACHQYVTTTEIQYD